MPRDGHSVAPRPSTLSKVSGVNVSALEGKCMRVSKLTWLDGSGWQVAGAASPAADLVLYFGNRRELGAACHASLRATFPDAILLGCSSGGQISGDDISDFGVHGLAIAMEKSRLAVESAACCAGSSCREIGASLAARLSAHASEKGPLAGVFILSDGLQVNGSELVAGMIGALGRDIPIMGGLAGDGADFAQTVVAANAPRSPALSQRSAFTAQSSGSAMAAPAAGMFRPAPESDAQRRQCAVRAGWRTGARSLQALSRR